MSSRNFSGDFALRHFRKTAEGRLVKSLGRTCGGLSGRKEQNAKQDLSPLCHFNIQEKVLLRNFSSLSPIPVTSALKIRYIKLLRVARINNEDLFALVFFGQSAEPSSADASPGNLWPIRTGEGKQRRRQKLNIFHVFLKAEMLS